MLQNEGYVTEVTERKIVKQCIIELWSKRILNATKAFSEKNYFRALFGLHDFSRCDSASAFHKIGNGKWLNMTKSTEIK